VRACRRFGGWREFGKFLQGVFGIASCCLEATRRAPPVLGGRGGREIGVLDDMTKKITKKPRVDVHAKITAQIIKSIEAGAGEWQMPWHRAGKGLNRPDNIDTKNHYRGINVLALWVEAMAQGFGSGTWGTYRQWQKQGCQVRKGEKASLVVIYKEIKRKDAKATPGDESSEWGMVFGFVFGVEEC